MCYLFVSPTCIFSEVNDRLGALQMNMFSVTMWAAKQRMVNLVSILTLVLKIAIFAFSEESGRHRLCIFQDELCHGLHVFCIEPFMRHHTHIHSKNITSPVVTLTKTNFDSDACFTSLCL